MANIPPTLNVPPRVMAPIVETEAMKRKRKMERYLNELAPGMEMELGIAEACPSHTLSVRLG